MKVLITGDLVVNREYNKSKISESIKYLFNQSSLNITNLEAPVTNNSSKILKTGPHLKAERESTQQVLEVLGVNVVTLANNHLLDYNEQGIADTIAFCKENTIQTVGAGMNLKEATQTLYINSNEGIIAIINFAENEWASATDETAGAHPMDIIDNAKEIKKAKEKSDFVFVIVHGGHEYYNLPSPRMQKQYRFYAEEGADIVIGHHTHCISGNEVYKGVPIYYSLGNFLFTHESNFEDWYIGLILEVEIQEGKLSTQIHPIKQMVKTFELQLFEHDEKQKVLNRVLSYNVIIADKVKLNREWSEFLKSKYDDYLNYWSPISFISNRYLKTVFRRLGLNGLNKKGLALILNLIRCEAHVDVSKAVTKKYLKK